jgi:ketosteroid isomerase-like protein
MSQENMEVVSALIERWNTGDRDATAISEYADPAIELRTPFASVGGEPYRGHAGVEHWIRDVDDQFSEWRIGVDELRPVAHRVLALVTVTGRGRASGVTLQFPSASIFDFARDGRITRMHIYPDRAEALRAVGLEDEAPRR